MFFVLLLTYVANCVIFLASLIGNSVLIHIIRTNDSMKTTTNYMILNQACADIWFTLAEVISVIVPFNHHGNRWFGGIFGKITCKCFHAIVIIPSVFSSWILVAIAVERFYAVTQPLRPSPISQHFKTTIMLLWTWSVASSTNIVINEVVFKAEQYYYCGITDTEWIIPHFILAALNIVLPLSILAVLYTIVCHNLWSREIPGEGTNQNQGQVEATNIARQVSLMMIVIVVLYVLCWFPYDINLALTVLGYAEVNSNVDRFLLWLTVAYGGINPYIYLAFNQKFRYAFRNVFGNCFNKIKNFHVLHFRSQSVELEQI